MTCEIQLYHTQEKKKDLAFIFLYLLHINNTVCINRKCSVLKLQFFVGPLFSLPHSRYIRTPNFSHPSKSTIISSIIFGDTRHINHLHLSLVFLWPLQQRRQYASTAARSKQINLALQLLSLRMNMNDCNSAPKLMITNI